MSNPKALLTDFLKEHKDEHYDFVESVYYKVSTGSLKLDASLGGGLTPGVHRFLGSSEGGKAQPIDEPILVNLVEFSDGSSTRCCDEHLWETTTVGELRLSKRYGLNFSSVKNTKYIKNTLRYGVRHNHMVPFCKPIEFSNIQQFKIKPYTLGCLIGDGGLTGASVTLTTVDDDLLCFVEDELFDSFDNYRHANNNGISFRLTSRKNDVGANEIKQELKELGLMGCGSYEKFIPKQYIYNASIDDRISLLHGLMDTDGTVKRKSCSCMYYTISPQLAKDVAELVRSLGGKCKINTKNGKYYSDKYEKWISCKLCYCLSISFGNGICPFRIERKKEIYQNRQTENFLYIKNIEYCGREECVCIRVANSDGLYITKDYIVTHNTSCALTVAKNFLITVPNSRVLIIKAEGRLSEKMKKKSKLKFANDASEWENGTAYVFKCNIYDTVAQLIDSLIHNNEDNVKYLFIIDSLDGLILKEDLCKKIGDGEHVKVAGPNVLSKRLLKQTNLAMTELGHMMIMVSQVIATISNKYEKRDQMLVSGSGGNAIIHFSNFILQFLPRFKKDLITADGKLVIEDFDNSNIVGHYCSVKITKSENEQTGKIVKYPIKYGSAEEDSVWTEYELIPFLLSWGYMVKQGSWFVFSKNSMDMMDKKGIKEIFEKIQGKTKLVAYLSRDEIKNFWVNHFQEMIKDDTLF